MVAYFLQILGDQEIARTACSSSRKDLLLPLHHRQELRFVVEHWICERCDFPRPQVDDVEVGAFTTTGSARIEYGSG